MNRCWAEKYCKGYPNKCEEYCIGYVQLSNIYNLSNMPKRYQYDLPLVCDPIDREAFVFLRDFQQNVEMHITEGHGLFIHSSIKGNGKTSWACKIMNEYFKKVALNNNLRCRGLFVNVLEFLEDLKRNMDDPSDDMREFQAEIKSADLVIWDDIGAQTDSKWVRQKLYEFTNYRESHGKSQIFTSNDPLTVLSKEDRVDERIANRIKGQCEIIELKGESKRDITWSNFGRNNQ